MKNTQHNPLNDSELFRPLCRYFMLTKALFSVYLSINSEYYLFLIERKIGILITIITKYCAKPLIRQAKTVQYKKRTV